MMGDPDSPYLDALLRSAGTVQRNTAEEERIYSDVWSRVQGPIGDDGATTFDDAVQERRPNLIADRETAARRRRATGLASAALAIAVAGGGTAVAAEFISSRTGEHTSGCEVAAAGPGEVLDLGGTGRPQVFEEVTADIPFPPGEERRLWLYGVARRLLTEHHRSAWKRVDAEGEPGDSGTPESPNEDDRRGEAVRRALEELSTLDRELVTLATWNA